MFRQIIWTLGVCLVLTGLAHAQEPQKPGPEHEKLKQQYEGKWNAVMEMEGQKSKASATYKAICGGMWIASDFEGDLGGAKFTGHGLDGYDIAKKKYIGIWVDSWGSAPMRFEGGYDDKNVLVMSGGRPGPDGKLEKCKTTTEWKDKDNFVFKMYMVNDGKDSLAFTITYSRLK